MDLEKYGFRKDYDINNRIVKQESVTYKNKEYFVSTVDLGINYQMSVLDPTPIYFETMIFELDEKKQIDGHDLYCDRYETREEALKEHNRLIELFNVGKIELVNGYFEEIK